MNEFIKVCDVEKYYGEGNNITKAVNRVSFSIDQGEFVGIMGASGSGKSTLLNMLSTIDHVTAGHIYYDGLDITALRSEQVAQFRKYNLGFVFQDFNLLDTLTIEENIRLAMTLHGKSKQEIDPVVHNAAFGGEYCDQNGQLDLSQFEKNNWAYYDYDTYMLEGDYNELRNLLGLAPITLGQEGYAIQVKPRVAKYLDEEIKDRVVEVGAANLKPEGIYTDDFSQNGHNGADFVIIVPDKVRDELTAYYSLYAAKLVAEPSDALKNKLDQYTNGKTGRMTEDEYLAKLESMIASGASVEEIEAFEQEKQLLVFAGISLKATGSDQIISLAADTLVQKTERQATMFAVASIIFPIVYIGLVFLCIALTILAVQQLSDSGKYRFRFDVLRKLGLSERQIDGVVWRQLLIYYMLPALFAVLLSSGISILAGNKFVVYTGASGSGLYYYGLSLMIFFGVYLLYFLATYVGFVRNIRK